MARQLSKLSDIAALEDAVSALAAEISSAYTIYLTALGPTVRQHLILASYHPCTQGYAKPFLSLSSTSGNNCSMPFVSWNRHQISCLLIPRLMRDTPQPSSPGAGSVATELGTGDL